MIVTEIQRFCMHDGPGLRTTVFLKGCPLSCVWCHNPETQSAKEELLFYPSKCIGCGICESACPNSVHTFSRVHEINRKNCISCGCCEKECPTGALEICGAEYTAEELYNACIKDKAFFGENGGITLSGGEPLFQGSGVVDFLSLCKERGLNTAVETCGFADRNILLEAIANVDLFLWDIKDTDPERHRNNTGVTNGKILENLRAANGKGAKIRLRCILVNGVNTNDEHYENIFKIATEITNLDSVEFLPYHAYSGSKATFLGKADNGNVGFIPSEEQLIYAQEYLRSRGIRIHGDKA